MSTRYADADSPLSQERYMSSREFAELNAISGTSVAKRCALLVSPVKRQLIWFIQGMSLEQGGLRRMAKELVEMFPERLNKTWNSVWRLDHREATREELLEAALERSEPGAYRARPQSIEEFLIDLCINPRLRFQAGKEDVCECEQERALEEYPGLGKCDFGAARLDYFNGIIPALVEYKRRYEQGIKEAFCFTAIGRLVWKQLDEALKTGTMSLIDGLEGRGKTEAVRAWCRCHLGVARFISLDGTSTKTTQFREMARALGVGHSSSRKVSEMQANVKEVLRVSKLMPVIDEAHFFFNQGPRMYTRPEMLDWIDTALCNPPLPVVLVTTPQFLVCMERAAGQVEWNYRQFRRRCKRYVRLPAKNTPEDIELLAKWLLPRADRATIKQVVAYEALTKRDLSAVGDVAREAQLLAEDDGGKLTFEHVKRAIHEVLLASDVPWAEMEKRLQGRNGVRGRDRGRLVADQLPEPATTGQAAGPAREVAVQRHGRGDSAGQDRCGQVRAPALEMVEA